MIERADINSVLQQMRELQSQAQRGMQPEMVQPPGQIAQNGEGESFADLLKGAVDQVAGAQSEAKALATAFERGDKSVDLHQVMISMEKASVSFQALTQVRNRMVTAYEDVMKMPI